MPIVIILDQQASRTSPDRVQEGIKALEMLLGRGLLRRPERTAGDEMQAVIGEPQTLPSAIEFCLRSHQWWMGIGLGGIQSLEHRSRESRGPAFVAARTAVEQAKRRRRRPIAVHGEPPEICERLQGMCDVLAYIVESRTPRQWEVVDAASDLGTGSRAAKQLGISSQAANEQLRAAGFKEQWAAQAEIGYLAAEAERRIGRDA
jgi:hypothetical protein